MDNRASRFMKTEVGISLRLTLEKMVQSRDYNTATMYSPLDKDGMTFVTKQMIYMSQYPNMNYDQYISNLRLKTKQK